jgi:glycosyltransferase involved in cell wall biosynthesis
MPPLLSVVVPVYQVERYLTQCLDSILHEAGGEVEVVAVDDHSPDSSGRIADAYAQRDPRVRVIHLAANVGLGRARNAGLAQARGRYVWFVDSDDWLPAGTVPAVLARLTATGPDVLVLDHAEVFEDGRVVRAGGPASASLPDLLRAPLATSACTKVIRRGLLDEIDLRFPPGWYEDCAYAVPLLLAAGRIDILDQVCYHYRQRSAGAITKSVSSRHFDIFEQYDRMWARVDPADPLRPLLFRLMIDHLLVVAGNDRRLPPRQRRPFFRRIAREFRQRDVRGYEVPGGPAGLKHRLVRRDAYLPYAALRLARQAVSGRRPAAPAAEPQPANLVAR